MSFKGSRKPREARGGPKRARKAQGKPRRVSWGQGEPSKSWKSRRSSGGTERASETQNTPALELASSPHPPPAAVWEFGSAVVPITFR